MNCNLCRTNVGNIERHRSTQRHRESLRIAKCAFDLVHPKSTVILCSLCNVSTGDLIQHIDLAHEDLMFKETLYSDIPNPQSIFDHQDNTTSNSTE
jgi:hypothetical protein